MRSMLLLLLVSALGGHHRVVHAGDLSLVQASRPASGIAQVLYRSQQARLDSLAAAERDTPAAAIIQLSLQRLIQALGLSQPVELRVIRGDTMAETVHGHLVVANETLAALPEGERLFILAHELGHVVSGHWSQMGDLFQKYVPGEVTQAHTDAVSEALGRDASRLARRHEFDADAFALRTLRQLGYADVHASAALSHFGFQRSSATHPSTRQRLAALCEIEAAPIETAGLDERP